MPRSRQNDRVSFVADSRSRSRAPANDDESAMDDDTTIATDFNITELELRPEDHANIATTTDHSEKEATRNEYRNRLQRMVDWCVEFYPEHASELIRPISDEELRDPRKHYHKQKLDFVYEKLTANIVLAFMATIRKVNPDGTGMARSFEHVRKFQDAVVFGARERGVVLSRIFRQKISTYLSSFKKERRVAARSGLTEEHDADPLHFPLYTKLCMWFIVDSDIFAWVYQILLWNCMGRSSSVDRLGLHNLKLGTDSLIVTYDDSKTDNTGERVHPKNIYANPYNPFISPFLALAVWCALSPDQFNRTDALFLHKGTELGVATRKFGMHLRAVLNNNAAEVATHGDGDRIKAHSARKGTATFLTAGTTDPPPLPSVGHRGEWSLGKVQDIYFNFAQPGDHYIGRMLAGLDSTSSTFGVLPPHFTCGIENDDVKEALYSCFGGILNARPNIVNLPGTFLLLLASIVYHEKWLVEFVSRNNNHPFANIMILQNHELLVKIRPLVTILPSENLPRSTGIPTHINMQHKLDLILMNNVEFLEQLRQQSEVIRESVQNAIQENDINSGNVTMNVLRDELQGHHHSIIDFITKNLANVSVDCRDDRGDEVNNTNDFSEPEEFDFVDEIWSRLPENPIYQYNGHFWDVAKSWKFNKLPTRRIGWEYWIKGQPGNTLLVRGIRKKAPVKPYRKLIAKRLPSKKQRGVYYSSWKIIFDYMEQCPNLNIPDNPTEITPDFIESSYKKATKYMEERLSFIFEGENINCDNWSVATWSKHVASCTITNKGTESDKDCLPLTYAYKPYKSTKRQKKRIGVPVVADDENDSVNRVVEVARKKTRNRVLTRSGSSDSSSESTTD
jgi:hypothetical protein